MTTAQARTVVMTGASDGIGAAAARQLAGSSARLVLVGRSPEKTRAIAAETGAEFMTADFTRLDEVRELAARLERSCDRIDVLANNAGGMFAGPEETPDGFEKTFQVNHLAPTLLTYLLRDRLIDSQAAVVATSSVGARLFGNIDLADLNDWNGFTLNKAYGDAKLGNILFTRGLHTRFADAGLSSVAFHPGVIATNFAAGSAGAFQGIYHGILREFLGSPERGGARLRGFIEGQPGKDWESGSYYSSPRHIGRTNRQAYDPEFVRRHWEVTADMLGIAW
ncbi:SDR family NAD(P)-dependent oxidoreductase [Leucobacter luti]|uniref:Short-subunit dehydrogenase n=1 Tax=Leucobacter luti TaxID=340320 RepID=A0A4Q7TY56_9MICO|nr:SDR family NAD(P)-dependent oxidoreductase [Leucobacter luti]MBL3698759.1 SDR family NAD(P)-dependent oxidoreductase [Leucobacter luti]RZT66136.1 short-subunit dehydrogenase [Leucobacter luti]